jgi:hypothetical protein
VNASQRTVNDPSTPNPAGNSRDAGKLPLDVTEQVLADLVEGSGTPDQLSRLNPRARALLDALVRDRKVLAGIPDEKAPAGLCDAVMARLERESLFEDPFATEKLSTNVLLTAEQFERHLADQELAEREALVGSAIGGIAGRIGPSPFRTRGMVAAAVLLIAGGGLYLFSLTLAPSQPATPGPLALNSTGPDQSPVTSDPAPPVEPAVTPTPTIARADPAPTPESGRTNAPEVRSEPASAPPVRVASHAPSPKGVVGSSIAAALAAADSSRVIDGPGAAARALQAAREGRLIIRVRSSDPGTARARLASVASEKQPESRAWRLTQATQPEIIAAATRAVPTMAERIAAEQERMVRARMMASAFSESGQPTSAMLKIEPPKPSFDPREHDGVFLLDVPATDTSLAMAKTVLAGTLLGSTPGLEPAAESIELVELENSVPSLPSTQVEAVMWWTQAPKDWIAHASVPVVIEER